MDLAFPENAQKLYPWTTKVVHLNVYDAEEKESIGIAMLGNKPERSTSCWRRNDRADHETVAPAADARRGASTNPANRFESLRRS
jgi:hypothetical protein